MDSMKTSAKARSLIMKYEGFRGTTYRCPAGVLTIGYGHTSAAGKPQVTAGMKITRKEAEDILANDLVKYERAVAQGLKVEVAQEQWDAMVSLCYNIGPGAFLRSSVLKATNKRQWADAARRFALWNKAGGRVLPGLIRRRAEEAAMYASAQPKEKIAEAEGQALDAPVGRSLGKSRMSLAGSAQVLTGVAVASGSVAEIKANVGAITDGVSIVPVALLAAAAVIIIGGAWVVYDRHLKSVEDGI